jgi:hypothetical protein
MSNKHSFIAYIRNKRSFSLIIDNLAIAVNWIAGIKISRIRVIVSQMLMQMNMPITLRVKRIKIINIITKLRMDFGQIISARRIKILANMKQRMNFIHTISARRISLSLVLRQIQKLGSVPIKLYKIIITADMLAAQYFLLSTYDPQTLSTMDTETLADLDYVVA